jgi:hypothetical protein
MTNQALSKMQSQQISATTDVVEHPHTRDFKTADDYAEEDQEDDYAEEDQEDYDEEEGQEDDHVEDQEDGQEDYAEEDQEAHEVDTDEVDTDEVDTDEVDTDEVDTDEVDTELLPTPSESDDDDDPSTPIKSQSHTLPPQAPKKMLRRSYERIRRNLELEIGFIEVEIDGVLQAFEEQMETLEERERQARAALRAHVDEEVEEDDEETNWCPLW